MNSSPSMDPVASPVGPSDAAVARAGGQPETADVVRVAGAVATPRCDTPVPLQRTLTYRLHQLHKLTDRDSQAAHLADTGLPLSEARCLTAIGTFEPLSVKDLARRANLDKAQASRAAQALAEQGLLSKQASPTDARGVVLTLTAAGHDLHLRAMQVVARRNREILSCLSPAEQDLLDQLFDRLIAHAQGGGSEARRPRSA